MQLFSHCCHQRPERSFFLGGYQLPLCARCCGMLLGQAAGLCSAFACRIPVSVCGILMLPMAADGLIQLLTDYRSTNPRRFLTGALFGFCLVSAAAQAVRYWMQK